MTDESKIIYFDRREDWRKWLEKNFNTSSEIWLLFPLKDSKKKSILYNDAVEEALCFGWIDSTVKSLDKINKIQRFTPRNPKSNYSQANIERLRWLLDNNMVHKSLIKEAENVVSKPFVIEQDIVKALQQDKLTWINFSNLSESYKRIRIAYIEAARKRPEEFNKRLANFVIKTKENKLIAGFGGINKYY